MTINETTTIAEIAAAHSSSVRVFQRHGIDFCCGGKRPLAAVCNERGLDFAEVASAITATTTARAEDRDWSHERLGALIEHILTTHHQPLREELPRLQAMAAKVATVHGQRAPELVRIDAAIGELATALVTHMQKEEAVLFPAIAALEATGRPTVPISAPIAVMEHEHDDAGALLAELRTLTNAYQPPTWGCATLRALYQGLAELESTMHVHVHLENNILFPRALSPANARVPA